MAIKERECMETRLHDCARVICAATQLTSLHARPWYLYAVWIAMQELCGNSIQYGIRSNLVILTLW